MRMEYHRHRIPGEQKQAIDSLTLSITVYRAILQAMPDIPVDLKGSLPIILFENQSAFEEWLKTHSSNDNGVWIKIAKKGSGVASISYDEAVESSLCYGWIDSQARSFDEHYYIQKFTPRRSRSKWSQQNCKKAEDLIAAERMQPAGYHQVELARQDGRWEAAYDPQSTITIPADFQEALDKNQAAREFFSSLNSSNRYAILHRLQITKNPGTRLAKIQKFIEMLVKNEKLYP
jgi:uncharacterized protein YdeI (YjbR/CyaY-like superfamily)